jgi:3,4-dihydroxy 2-butanone 4-phosphate synthase/GTP cyclohydrolase II
MTEQPEMQQFAHIERAIDSFREGQFLVVSDDEDRENEGDLIIAAEHVTPQAVNFMITHGRGLVCIAITEEIAARHQLYPMVERNGDHMQTAFTVSVDATLQHGVTTGISAGDRAKTIELLIADNPPKNCLHAPGHMFPLVAKRGGVLTRQGHTEAAVDLARTAGLKPAGVIVEIIKADGEMARRADLLEFSAEHGLEYITIKDLCAYLRARSGHDGELAKRQRHGRQKVPTDYPTTRVA